MLSIGVICHIVFVVLRSCMLVQSMVLALARAFSTMTPQPLIIGCLPGLKGSSPQESMKRPHGALGNLGCEGASSSSNLAVPAAAGHQRLEDLMAFAFEPCDRLTRDPQRRQRLSLWLSRKFETHSAFSGFMCWEDCSAQSVELKKSHKILFA